MAVSIQKFSFNGFQENTYVVHDGSSCVIIDPGCYDRHEQEELSQFIDSNNLKPLALLLTHAHIDHVLGCSFVLKKYDIDFYMHKDDTETLESVSNYSSVYGFPGYIPPKLPNKELKHDEIISFGEIKFLIKHTPGHAPGHVVFYNEEHSFVINGDVLFAGSFGRTDLPGGSMEILKETIHNIMFNFPEDTVVYCGHGGETTIGQEKQTNYILQF